jgi:hypothetical protein
VSATAVTSEVQDGLLDGLRHAFVPAVLILLGASIELWLSTLPSIHVDAMGRSGLAGVLPVTWYVAAAMLVAGTLVVTLRRRPNGLLVAAFITAVVLVLYGTMPAVSAEPAYAWLYKHIGVTHLIMSTGAIHPHVDIYNRWPGMFALAAAFSKLTGIDPLGYAGWFEPLATLLDAVLVAAIAHAVTRDRRAAGMAALLLVIRNWVAQDYFSPQATAYPLYLVLMLVVIRQFRQAGWLRQWLTLLVARIFRRAQSLAPLADPLPMNRAVSVAIVLVLTVVSAATHQLTPYMAMLQVGMLTLLGLRPVWLMVAIAAIPLAYLVPNFSYIQSHYGLLNSLDPFDNAQVRAGVMTHGPWFYGHAGGVLSVASLLTAAAAALVLMRRGRGYPVIALGGVALAPYAVLLATSYGGEGPLRVFLFSSPWTAILLGWGLCSIGRKTALALGAAVCAVLCGLFMFAFSGFQPSNRIPPGEVRASEYFGAHAPRGSVLGEAGEGFPARVSAGYAAMNMGYGLKPLLEDPRLSSLPTEAAITAYSKDLLQFSPHAFLAFSTSETVYGWTRGVASRARMARLEAAVARSPVYRLWHRWPDARIYVVRQVCTPDAPCRHARAGRSARKRRR